MSELGVSFIRRRSFLRALAGSALYGGFQSRMRAESGVKITSIETLAFDDPGKYSFTIVRVRTSAGIDGIGQAESPSLVIDAAIRTHGGLEDLLRGEDPVQVERLWQKMYDGTGLWGRRGVTIAAMGAVETALWDIAGKILKRPVCELIWRSFATSKEPAAIKMKVRPYATVYAPGDTEKEIRHNFGVAVERGFQAMKFEEYAGGFAHVSAKNDARLIRIVREILGEDRDLMIDVQNAWYDVGQAVATCKLIEPYNVFFLEAPFPPDNLDAYRRLSERVDIRIAAGDWGLTTRFEYMDLMDRGRVGVVQPSTVRSGGIGEIMKIAEIAYRKGLLCITHSWNHMIGVAAAVHVAAVVPNMPYFEYPVAFPPSPLISDLLVPALVPDALGWIEVPRRPGLGYQLNEEIVKRYRVEPS
jgi:L-alanine-DL-glutamate epimerase-like enolase superfamily enzyme